MTSTGRKNLAASVHQRLLNIAKDTRRPFNEVLQYFAMERFLYRIAQSEHAGSIILKGALLFRVWEIPDSRATRDIDLLAYTDNSPTNLAHIVEQLCAIPVDDDGLRFDPDSVEGRTIKEGADYEGVRIRFHSYLGNARIPMQIDVGFGDAVHPSAVSADYPTILDFPPPNLRIYPRETVIAEKTEAMIKLGTLNSRAKDFYDIWRMSQQFEFDLHQLYESVAATFERRETNIDSFETVFSDLANSENLQIQWTAFIRKSKLTAPDLFPDVLVVIGNFLSPVFASKGTHEHLRWIAPGPWVATEHN